MWYNNQSSLKLWAPRNYPGRLYSARTLRLVRSASTAYRYRPEMGHWVYKLVITYCEVESDALSADSEIMELPALGGVPESWESPGICWKLDVKSQVNK